MREIAEREKRQSSIVIKGFGGDVAKATSEFSNIVSELGVNVTLSEVIKINDELIRAKILNPASRKALLDKAKHLKTSLNYSGVFIRCDLTKTQRSMFADARRKSNQLISFLGHTPLLQVLLPLSQHPQVFLPLFQCLQVLQVFLPLLLVLSLPLQVFIPLSLLVL